MLVLFREPHRAPPFPLGSQAAFEVRTPAAQRDACDSSSLLPQLFRDGDLPHAAATLVGTDAQGVTRVRLSVPAAATLLLVAAPPAPRTSITTPTTTALRSSSLGAATSRSLPPTASAPLFPRQLSTGLPSASATTPLPPPAFTRTASLPPAPHYHGHPPHRHHHSHRPHGGAADRPRAPAAARHGAPAHRRESLCVQPGQVLSLVEQFESQAVDSSPPAASAAQQPQQRGAPPASPTRSGGDAPPPPWRLQQQQLRRADTIAEEEEQQPRLPSAGGGLAAGQRFASSDGVLPAEDGCGAAAGAAGKRLLRSHSGAGCNGVTTSPGGLLGRKAVPHPQQQSAEPHPQGGVDGEQHDAGVGSRRQLWRV